MNRQRLILLVLVIIFILVSVWSYTSVPRPRTVDKLTYAPGQQAKPAPATDRASSKESYDSRILNMAMLEKEHSDFKGYRRNLFKPIYVDEQKLLKQKAAAIKPPQQPPAKTPVPAAAPPVVVQPQAAPLARFTFLGFLKNDSRQTIFLAKDKDIILVKKGDKIAGRYLASSITDQALTLRVTDTGGEIVIPLIENQPLSAVK